MSRLSQISALRPATSQDVATSGTSATSTAFGSQTYCIRIVATADVRFRVVEASGGAAVAADSFLPAKVVDYVVVTPGQKIAAIQDSAPGKLNITEMT